MLCVIWIAGITVALEQKVPSSDSADPDKYEDTVTLGTGRKYSSDLGHLNNLCSVKYKHAEKTERRCDRV